ncbi:Hsp20/alpha crystallin family protein [Pyxidicoccus xibeiensis]|uniref:Hsp20/alpha crystallin family protein n=1 Tax=Pyxidicoccus xibeiensis TaxID=2906759 RepID=UPI0020A7A0B9|nr:HSP20 family small heat-shock protein [Pyxidicoccus xibeiensis]MCP3139932.1 Hsp20 family protein [Pyxidicoccus xibeiensis]
MADIIRRESTVPRRGRDPFSQMQELLNWDPFEVMTQLMGNAREAAPTFIPAFEVKESGDAFIFKADLPGVQEKDLEIALTGDRLVVSGKRESEKREENERYFAYERSFGSFSRAFTLPEGVDADHVSAELKDGVLHLTLPKRPEVQPRRIKVGGGTTSADKPKA